MHQTCEVIFAMLECWVADAAFLAQVEQRIIENGACQFNFGTKSDTYDTTTKQMIGLHVASEMKMVLQCGFFLVLFFL